MTLRFDHPAALLLALVAVVVIPTGWRALSALDPTRRVLSLMLRVLVIGALAVLLAGPRTVREHDHLTVIGLLDVSGSVQRFGGLQGLGEPAATSNLEYLRQWFRQATGTRADDDRIGLIAFDGQAMAVAVPTRGDYTDDGLDVRTIEGTNIADAISLALAMFPADTARRIVLMTDGNQTIGDALNTARQAAGGSSLTGSVARFGVPIDVAPIAYRTLRDVQIAAVEAPATARPGQTVTVRVILEAIQPTRGLLTLTREGEPVDLNGAAPGVSRAITAPAGPSVQLVQVMLGETPVNRFEAVFEPADPREDLLPDNNRAEAFTATPTRGKSLVVTRAADPENTFLVRTLRQADLPVEARSPADLPADLLSLQRYDLIVLDNIPAYDVGRPQQERLRDYVHDLGGGLVMVGGEDSFGAGGWNGSPLESVLPLELDPPRELRLPTAALVLVLDRSGSMNERVSGARATQQQVANEAAALAIESLRDDSLVGVVTFDSWPHVRVPLQRNDDPTAIADRVRGITADGGTNIGPALRRAHAMLADAEVDRKRVVCLSDGRSPTRNLDAIARNLAADDIRLTTIAVGDKADHETMERLAEIGRGEFYPVYNPATLPRILVDSVQVLNKPLIKEGQFLPVVRPTGSTLTIGMEAAPPLGGLVITAPRDDPTVIMEMLHPDGEPLLAHWQAGLGRVAAFTADSEGPWSTAWLSWSPAAAFWTQLARTIARPPVDFTTELAAIIQDDTLHIALEAYDRDGRFLDYLTVDGTVYGPDGRDVSVRLRQTGPGQYEGRAPAPTAGNYIVALSPRHGARRLAPAIGGASKASSAEFRRYQSNLAVLEQIVQLTGGRRLDLAAPESVDLFDRTGMPPSVSAVPAWRPLLWLALGLLLLDIACRRIAWSTAAIRAALARALARVAPAHVQGRAAEATLASLRQVSEQVEHRIEADRKQGGAPAAPRSMPTRPVARETGGDGATTEPQAKDAGRIAAALQALLGRSGTTAPRTRPPESEQEPKPEPDKDRPSEEDAPPGDSTTGSLLAAKRRARRRLTGEDE